MIWNICFVVSMIGIVASLIVFTLYHRSDKREFKFSVKVLIIGFATALFVMFIPIQLDAFGVDPYGIIKAVLAAVNRTLRAFALTDINFMNQNASISRGMYYVYSFAMMILCFICPLLTVGYILSFFAVVRVGVRLFIAHGKNLYIFSQLNEKSLALASDLSARHPEWRVVFCGISDTFKDKNDALVSKAEAIGAICHRKDLTSLNLRRHSKSKSLWFFAIDNDDLQNTNDTLCIIKHYRNREHTRVYLFSSLLESQMIFSSMDPGAIKVRLIRMTRSTIYQMLYSQGKSLFKNARGADGSLKTVSAVIVGLDRYGRELTKALAWYCQVDGYRPEIDAFGKSDKAQEHFAAECPDLLSPDYNGSAVNGEAQYTIRLHPDTDYRSQSFYKQLESVPTPTFVFVSLGDDSENIEVSVRLRTFFERRGVKPDIVTVIRNNDKKKLIEDSKNFKQQSYGIRSVGDIESMYSEKQIIGSELEAEALRLHLLWGDEDSFWQYEYYYQSSLARAIYLKVSRELSDSDDRDDKDMKTAEHRRWNAYMRSLGYVYSGSPDPSSRNDLAMVHNDLIPYDQLSEAEQQKDREN